jgi:hypothetical protein
MISVDVPEGWELISTAEIQASTVRADTFLSNSLQGLNLTNEILARLMENVNNALTNLCRRTPIVSIRILCRYKRSYGGSNHGIGNPYNHSPPAAWNYFIIERTRDLTAVPLIDLYLFPD